MYNELLPAVNVAEVKNHLVPCIRANYGSAILRSLFGVNYRIMNEGLTWTEGVGSSEKIKEILDKGVPDLRAGLGARVIDTQIYYAEKLGHFPKCQKYIHIYHPDLQGPFEVAHLIWGPDIYYALHDEPDLVHELLDLVTTTYIAFMKELKKTLNDEEDEFCCQWNTLYKGKSCNKE